MTVAELIEKLQKLPPTTDIYSYDMGDGGYGDSTEIPTINYCEKINRVVIGVYDNYRMFSNNDWRKV